MRLFAPTSQYMFGQPLIQATVHHRVPGTLTQHLIRDQKEAQ
jgi:hypothetical protein